METAMNYLPKFTFRVCVTTLVSVCVTSLGYKFGIPVCVTALVFASV